VTGEASRPRSWPPGSADNAALRPNNDLADHGDLGTFSEADLTEGTIGFQSVTDGAVFNLGSFGLGIAGAIRGAKNLSAGFIVCIPGDIAPSDALLSRKGLICVGTLRTFTGWPGRYGQEVVEGSLVL
jgi:hypothetical protein